ncbi:hypothetical protein IJH66_01365 [Candidatus Saccharibacteria bacterium]|nr:hypothetical protein [Candidatus Saccharibacteria bacterium]
MGVDADSISRKVILMSALFRFLTASPWNWIPCLLVYWLIWPGLMFLVAAIFESRAVYLGKGQSRMFFPGDFFLGVWIITFMVMDARYPVQLDWAFTPTYWLIVAAVFIVVMIGVRIPDSNRYPVRSANSPTKLTHDFIGYFLSPFLISGFGVPQLVYPFVNFDHLKLTWKLWALVFGCFAVFLGLIIYDCSNPPTKIDMLRRHPDDWKPIWRK